MLEYDKKELGSMLAKARKKKGLTQTEVGLKMNFSSAQFVSNIERGMCVTPLTLLARLIKLYGMNPTVVMNFILEAQRRILRKKLRPDQ